jgi:hypothetical protein
MVYVNPNETEDDAAVLRKLEKIVYETLGPAEAEAYIARLRHLLNDLQGTSFPHQIASPSVSPSEAESAKGTGSASSDPPPT